MVNEKLKKHGRLRKAVQAVADVMYNPNSPECIRCGECTKVCRTGALHFNLKKQSVSHHTKDM